MARMAGKMIPYGPGGRDCVCCGAAPGKPRKITKRAHKRGERQRVMTKIRNDKEN